MKPKVVDLFAGLGGFSEAFIAEGYEAVGYDIEAHDYGTGGYPGTLILRDVRSIHGSEFADAACIVASPPCQAYSYRAMPWKRAKALPPPDNTLFNECFRIQREACAAAGHYIPMVVENVRGAQPWVGRAKANFGSFYLWGDVGMVGNRVVAIVEGKLIGTGVKAGRGSKAKIPGFRFDGESHGSFQSAAVARATKNDGSGWTPNGSMVDQKRMVPYKVPGISLSEVGFNVAAAQRYREARNVGEIDAEQGTKQGGDWFGKECSTSMSRLYGSKSDSRKAASAMIAKIPYPLSQYLARSFKP